MSKTILIGAGGTAQFDIKVQKWNMLFFGILFIAQGFLYMFSLNQGAWAKPMMMMTFLSGTYVIMFALLNFSRTSRFSPKVKVDNTKVEFKTSLYKKGKSFNWQDIQSIRFKSFRIDFKTNNTVEVIAYDCTSDISIDIKETIREFAEKNNIEVIGG